MAEIKALLEQLRRDTEHLVDDPDAVRVPEEAYQEAESVLQNIAAVSLPAPDVMCLENGGIGLEWRKSSQIVTVSLYGDGHAVFSCILGDKDELHGVKPLEGTPPRLPPMVLDALTQMEGLSQCTRKSSPKNNS